jgi:alpha-1,6-mannosyltransferase
MGVRWLVVKGSEAQWATRGARRVRRLYEDVAGGLESGIQLLERRYTPLGRFKPGPFEGWEFLWQPAVVGFFAMCLLFAGGSFPNSPLKLDMASTWFFGEPARAVSSSPNQTTLLLSVVLGYGGLALLMRVWLRLVEVLKLHPGAPLRSLWWMFAMWAGPMLLAPPMFSRDVFSYAAQGEMTSLHLSPYLLGPYSLGSSPFVNPVDPLWLNAPAPYGPFFLFLDGSIDRLAQHNQLATVIGLRLIELLAVIAIGLGVTALAKCVGRDRGETFALCALNPIVLITLVDGAHNDALMTAFLVWAIVLALRRHLIWAVVVCSCAAAIKAPAALGLGFIAWTWLGSRASVRERLRPIGISIAVTTAVFAVWTWLAGFGWGWVANLTSNGAVRSWDAPVTAAGLALADTGHVLGFHSLSVTTVLTVTRFAGFCGALAITAWLLLTSRRHSWVRALGLSLIVLVVLGPVVQPWYFVWGIALLSATYVGRQHFWMLLMSIIGPFAGLPGGRDLVTGLAHSNVILIATAILVLGGVLVVPMGHWTQWSWSEESHPVLNA